MSSKSTLTDASSGYGTKRKRLIPAHERGEEVPWTAARCNRLLRTITSRINVLRKISKNFQDDRVHSLQAAPCAHAPEGSFREASAANSSRADANSPTAKDPEWLPQERKRQHTRTYTSRTAARQTGIKKGVPRPEVVENGLRTPFVKRLLSSNAAYPSEESPSQTTISQPFPRAPIGRKRKPLPTLPTTSADKAYKTLLEAFSTLLSATHPSTTAPSRLGTSSLLNACLRKVPAYIELEQLCNDDEDDGSHNREDVATETYDFLGSLGGSVDGGWSGLKVIVRAHAMHLIQNAVRDGVFPADPLENLLDICRRHNAHPESQSILRTWFESGKASAGARLDKFVRQCTAFGYRSLLLQTCGDMFQRGILQMQDIVEHQIIWSETVKAFATPATRGAALSFCEAFILCCTQEKSTHQHESDVCPNTNVYDAIVLLTALIWTHKGHEHSNDMAQHLHLLAAAYDLAAEVAASTIRVNAAHRHNASLHLARPFSISSLVLQVAGLQPADELIRLDPARLLDLVSANGSVISEQQDGAKHITTIRDFICAIAKSLLHVDKAAAHNFVQATVSGLLQVAPTCHSAKTALMRAVATESAKTWAEHCDDNESYNFAEEIDYAIWESATRGEDDSEAGGCDQKPVSYRWEEGLCEWIAKTPRTRDSGVHIEDDPSCVGFHDSGIEIDDESPPSKLRARCASRSRSSPASRLRSEEADDEDELALLTPMLQRSRFQPRGLHERKSGALGDVVGRAMMMPPRGAKRVSFGTVEGLEDASDDELALG